MKFATAILSFSRKKGGAERYLVDLCTRLSEEGNEVHVYTEHGEEDGRIHLHRVRTLPFPKSLRRLSFALRATREMEKGDYDITLGVGNTLRSKVIQPHGGVHWAWFWRSLRVHDHPAIWAVKFLGRVLSANQWVSGWIEDAPYRHRRLAKVVAISEMVKRDIQRSYFLPENRITVIYRGVDKERFHPGNWCYRDEVRKRHGIGEEKMVLFVSNHFKMKGLRFLMKALAEMKVRGTPPFKLLVVGGDRPGPYRRLARRIGLSEEILFVGSTDEPEKYYGAADLLVHPTFYDGCSPTVLEALATGLPVITTLHNGASGLIREAQDGWVIEDPREIGQLIWAIQNCFEAGVRNRPRQRVVEGTRVDSEGENLEKTIAVFREVLEYQREK